MPVSVSGSYRAEPRIEKGRKCLAPGDNMPHLQGLKESPKSSGRQPSRSAVASASSQASRFFELFEPWRCFLPRFAPLAKQLRRALILRDLHGMSYQQVARATGITDDTVKSRVFRARLRPAKIFMDRTGGQRPPLAPGRLLNTSGAAIPVPDSCFVCHAAFCGTPRIQLLAYSAWALPSRVQKV